MAAANGDRLADDTSTCFVCFASAVCWRVLRIAGDEARVPDGAVLEGGVGDHVDGYLPLCGDCLLVCPACDHPVVPAATEGALALVDTPLVVLRWAVDPCDDPTHERPGLREPPSRPGAVVAEGPPRRTAIPNQMWVADAWRGVRVGDEVSVPGLDGVRGRVFQFWSHRRAGGAACTIVLPDGSWLIRLASAVVAAKRADDAQSADPGAED